MWRGGNVDGIYFTPSVLESFIQSELTRSFNQNATTIACSSWKDCRELENGFCVAGRCFASNAYFHNAVDPAFEGRKTESLLILVVGSNSYRINMTIPSPLYTEPYWGGYYGSNPSVRVYQVHVERECDAVEGGDVGRVGDSDCWDSSLLCNLLLHASSLLRVRPAA